MCCTAARWSRGSDVFRPKARIPSSDHTRSVVDRWCLTDLLSSSFAQVACETATKTGMVMVFGEITTQAKVDYEAIVRKTCRDIGFTSEAVGLDADTCKVRSSTELQLCSSSLRFGPAL